MERKVASQVIERINAEYSGRVRFDPYFWEYEPMGHHRTFQDQIPPTSDFDVVICILWSRLGTPLTGPDGRSYLSGTQYEVESAKQSYIQRGSPELFIYWNRTSPRFPAIPVKERKRLNEQLDMLVEFVERNFKNIETGEVKGAAMSYRDLGEFEDRLDRHLRRIIERQLPPGESPALPGPVPVTWKECPFQGLNVFEFEHAPIFFGRTRAIGEVTTALRNRVVQLDEARQAAISGEKEAIDPTAAAFVLISAMSGVGKSSLARAGVLPLLTQPGNGIAHWRRVIIKPSQLALAGESGSLFDAVAHALVQPEGLPELAGGETTERELAFTLRQNPAGIDPMLRQALNQVSATARIEEDNRLAEAIRKARAEGRVHDIERISAIRSALKPAPARLVFLVDQMEELFTIPAITPELRAKFIQALGALARSGSVWVIVTLRSDYFGRCAEIDELMDLKKGEGTYDLKPPSAEEIGQMIRRPALAAGLRFEHDSTTDKSLDEELRDVAIRSPEALPLLEFTLERLYASRTSAGLLTWAAYREMGGLAGSVASHAEAVIAKLDWDPETETKVFDKVMAGLVILGAGDGKSAARLSANYEALTSSGPDAAFREKVKLFVDGFISARLFVVDKDTAGVAIVSIAHEMLLGRKPSTSQTAEAAPPGEPRKDEWLWKRLGDWIDRNGDFLRTRAQVLASLRQWEGAAHDESFLLQPGRALLYGEALLKNHREALSGEEQGYIVDSIDSNTRRERRRAKVRALVMTALILLATGAAIGGALGFWEAYRAGKEATETSRANQKDEKDLRDASMADYGVALERLNEPGKIAETVAHLARALEWDGSNRYAAALLWQTVVTRISASRPICDVDDPRGVPQFSPDGTEIVMADGTTARIWDVFTGAPIGKPMAQDDDISDAEFSPDGTRIVTVSGAIAQVWNAANGERIGKPILPDTGVELATYSTDGKRILTRTNETDPGITQIWDAASGQEIDENLTNDPAFVKSTAINPEATRIITASENIAQLWDANANAPVGKPIFLDSPQDIVVLSPDGSKFAVIGDSSTQIWNASDGARSGKPLVVDWSSLDFFSPDGSKFATVSDSSAQIWETITGDQIGSFTLDDDEASPAVLFSPDSERFLTTSNSKIQVWDASTGQAAGDPISANATVKRAIFSPDGSRFITIDDNWLVQVWDTANGQPIGEPIVYEQDSDASGSIFDNVRFSPDGTRILTRSSSNATIWDAPTGAPVAEPLVFGENDEEEYVSVADFSQDGASFVTLSGSDMQLWDAATCEPTGKTLDIGETIDSAALNRDGSKIVSLSGDNAQVWDIASGGRLGKPFRAQDDVKSASFNYDGSRVITLSDSTAEIWDFSRGECVGSVGDNDIVEFNPGGTQIITLTDTTEQIWDAGNGKPIGPPLSPALFAGIGRLTACSPDGTRAIALSCSSVMILDVPNDRLITETDGFETMPEDAKFSPDGKRVAVTCRDASLYLWDAVTGQKLGESHIGADAPANMSFSRDGTMIALGLKQQPAYIADTSSGRQIAGPFGAKDWESGVQFSPDGTKLFTDSGDSGTRIWNLVTYATVPAPVPQWLPGFAKAVVGLQFDSSGGLVPIPGQERNRILTESHDGNDFWSRFARWAVCPRQKRNLDPISKLTLRQVAERERDLDNQDSLELAIAYDPSVPLAHLMLASFETDEKRASFLRKFELDHLPHDTELWSQAAEILTQQKEPKLAIQAANEALELAPESADAQRVAGRAFAADSQFGAALKEFKTVMASSQAAAGDFLEAGYTAALAGNAAESARIFGRAEREFPKALGLFRYEGWAQIALKSPANAVDLFSHYQSLRGNEVPDEEASDAIRGLAVSRWLAGDQAGAVAEYQRLIASDPSWADAGNLDDVDFSEVASKPLHEVLDETLRQHPQLKPKPDAEAAQ